MLSVILILILAMYFFVISEMLKAHSPEERTAGITKYLSRIISLAPVIGIVIFTILFTFILKGRLLERATHAFLVLAMWIYATRFYQYILEYYEKKEILICSAIGMVYSTVLAVLLTPLKRYVSLVYSHISWYSISLCCGLYIVFYAVYFRVKK